MISEPFAVAWKWFHSKRESSAKQRAGFSDNEKLMMTLSREISEGNRIAGMYKPLNYACFVYCNCYNEVPLWNGPISSTNARSEQCTVQQTTLSRFTRAIFFCKQRHQGATNDNLYQNIYAIKKGVAPLK